MRYLVKTSCVDLPDAPGNPFGIHASPTPPIFQVDAHSALEVTALWQRWQPVSPLMMGLQILSIEQEP